MSANKLFYYEKEPKKLPTSSAEIGKRGGIFQEEGGKVHQRYS